MPAELMPPQPDRPNDFVALEIDQLPTNGFLEPGGVHLDLRVHLGRDLGGGDHRGPERDQREHVLGQFAHAKPPHVITRSDFFH